MSNVEIKNVTKRYGSHEVLRGLNLSIGSGQFCALLGQSGCGKSTLLRMIAGIEGITEGDISIAGVRANGLSPSQRRIAMVFQSYALYPHMTVRENISFSLKLAKVPKETAEKRTADIAHMLQLSHLLDRRPAQLSGGQRQRVAMGRALVRDPQVFLFDEPLSNLDAQLRATMRLEIAKLHQELSATMIYVTHDQVEAMTLADLVVVMNQGEISQVAAPMELYNAPANKFVASFIGSTPMNFLNADIVSRNDETLVLKMSQSASLAVVPRHPLRGERPASVEVGIRPEHIDLGPPEDARAVLQGRVQFVERLGNSSVVYLDTAAGSLVVQETGETVAKAGDSVGLILRPDRIHIFGTHQVAL